VTVEEAITARVEGLAAVIALAGDRVYLDKLPQSPTYPAVRVQLIDDPTTYHLRGPNGLSRARVQVDHYVHEDSGEDPYAAITALEAATKGDGKGTAATGLSGWKGSVGSPPFAVRGCFRTNRLRRYDPDELRVLTMSVDYIVWFLGA
jgi:hypothetical protein